MVSYWGSLHCLYSHSASPRRGGGGRTSLVQIRYLLEFKLDSYTISCFLYNSLYIHKHMQSRILSLGSYVFLTRNLSGQDGPILPSQVAHQNTRYPSYCPQALPFSVVTQAITSGDLPTEAKTLSVDHPRTSKFYMLPKIHKPGNPGRPLVSACNCPTSNISAYLDSVLAPLVKQLPTYVKDSSHALQILESFSFTGSHRYLLTMDIKSLYTVIPNNDGLQALKYHLDLRPEQQPPTHTLVRLAELVLNLNCFDFDGNYYQQVGGVAMGTKMGPNYACLFVGYVEGKMFEEYQGRKPALYKRYIDDVLGASSDTRQDLENFIHFCSTYHPALKYTFEISESSVPFLDLCVSISNNRVATTIHYKATDTHNYLEYNSSLPTHCRNAIPFSQFLRLRRICSDDGDYDIKSAEMASFFQYRGYPRSLITRSRQRAKEISRERALRKRDREHGSQRSGKVPLPSNHEVKKILLTNFHILREDPTTAHIFNSQPLCVHRRETNLRDILVHSTLASRPEQDQAPPGTFPCNRPRCRTCNFTAKTDTITSTGGSVHLNRRFDCTATGVIYAILCQRCHMLYIGETSRKLSDRFGEHLRSVEGYNRNSRYHGGGFPVAEHFNLADHSNIQDMKVTVVKQVNGGTASRQREERRLIFKLKTLAPSGMNIDFKFI